MNEVRVSDREAKKYTRRSWLAFAALLGFGGAGWAGWAWLRRQPLDGGIRGGIPQPLRDALNGSDDVFTRTFSNARLLKRIPEIRSGEEGTRQRQSGP